MIHGRRRVDTPTPVGDLGASAWKAAIGVLIAGACTYAIAQGFRL
jgi:hypothetical protein